MTHTYVLMEVSEQAFSEVKKKLLDAGYEHAIEDGELDMHGIALTKEKGMNLCGELYMDDDGEAHFICHTPGDMSFADAHNGLQKFIDLLESKFDKQKECPHHESGN